MNEPAEKSDASAGPIVLFAAVLLAVVLLILWGSRKFMKSMDARMARESSRVVAQAPVLPPEPRLEQDPHRDLMALRDKEDNILNSYGWVDQAKGISHVPIEQAMNLVLRDGLPAREGKK